MNGNGGADPIRGQLNEILEAIVRRYGSLRGAGQRCGRSVMWIWRQLRQNKSFDLGKVAEALASLEVPQRFFFEEIADAAPAFDPAWVLGHFHPAQGPLDPFLAAAQQRMKALLELPAVRASIPRRQSEIQAIEGKRCRDPEGAKSELELLAGELLAAAGPQGVPRGLLADLAHLLLAWSAVQRSRGRTGDSVESCALAGRAAEAAGDPKSRGLFYLQGSRLMADLGKPAHALRFAQNACGQLQCERKSGLLAAAIVQKSIALADLAQPRESRLEAINALRLAARNDRDTRTAAWLQLANLADARHRDRRALGCLERAKRNARATRPKAILDWRRALVLGRLGRLHEANRAYRAAIAVFDHHNLPRAAARIAVDQLEMSLKNGRHQDVLARVRAASPSFEQLGSQSRAFELWMDLCALLLAEGARASPLALIAAVRRALDESGGGWRSREN